MDIDLDGSPVRRLEVVETGRRRRWSVEAKQRIVEESLAVGVSASSVARRHGISPAHLFLWRKAYREGSLAGSWRGGAATAFAPVTLLPIGRAGPALENGRMEVIAANGRRVVVGSDVDPEALARVLRVLEG